MDKENKLILYKDDEGKVNGPIFYKWTKKTS